MASKSSVSGGDVMSPSSRVRATMEAVAARKYGFVGRHEINSDGSLVGEGAVNLVSDATNGQPDHGDRHSVMVEKILEHSAPDPPFPMPAASLEDSDGLNKTEAQSDPGEAAKITHSGDVDGTSAPKPFNSADFEGDDGDVLMKKQLAAHVKVGVSTLTPPTPFNISEFEDEDDVAMKKRLAAHVKTGASALTPPTPFNFSELEGDYDDVAMKERLAAHVKAGANTLTPPTPFNFSEFEDGDDRAAKKKRAFRPGRDSSISMSSRKEEKARDSSTSMSSRKEEMARDSSTSISSRKDQMGRDSSISMSSRKEQMEDDEEFNTAYRGGGDAQATGTPARRRGDAPEEGDREAQRQIPASATPSTSAQPRARRSRATAFINLLRARTSTLPDGTMHADVGETGEILVQATLVEEGEIVVAERVGFFAQNWKILASSICFCLLLVVLLAILLPLLTKEEAESGSPLTYEPSMQPSSSPTFDPRPTLQIVQERGSVLCGLRNEAFVSVNDLRRNLCRAVAAVLLGNPDSFEGVLVTSDNRFQQLNDRAVDLLLYGDTHTIEREVREKSTGAGFAFSSPYYYNDMTFFGKEPFVRCAEEYQLFADCSSLKICVIEETVSSNFIQSSFPSPFYLVGSALKEVTEMLLNNSCNVIADGRLSLLDAESSIKNSDQNFILGEVTEESEPYAIATRNNDAEFSNIVNWVVQALFYGEEQGITKDSSLCQNYTHLTAMPQGSDLNFLNAVFCVGSYYEICGDELKHLGLNKINNGTAMLRSTPLGDLESQVDGIGYDYATARLRLNQIRKEKMLNCGVVTPEDFDGEIEKSRELVGMSADYCRALAAALFNGDYNLAKLTPFSENDNSSFVALNNGTIDVLAGGKAEKRYNFATSSTQGFHFSTPYYYGNESARDGVSSFSMVTRNSNEDGLFSSLVNLVVVATMYAQENGIDDENRQEMPLLTIFGDGSPKWALRNSVFYSGSYDQFYGKHFGVVSEEDRGRNQLNDYDGPQIHSFPGLSPIR